MKKFTIVSIVGTRPQFIKLAEMDKAIQEHTDFNHIIIHTGQHFDANMSGGFFDELQIPKPDIELNINSGTHGENTGAMIPGIEKYLDSIKPNIVFVYGDCDSTLAGTIAAKKMNIPVAHIEAGVRSGDIRMPEEQNRLMVDSISDLLFTPTREASSILDQASSYKRVHQVGDLMYDSFKRYENKAPGHEKLHNASYYFATFHRKENVDAGYNMLSIITALGDLDWPVMFPAHPRTLNMIKACSVDLPENIKVMEPLSYLSTLSWMRDAKAVLTDSGGLQKEAFWARTPCVTMRNSTEWPETVRSGWNILTGADTERIKLAVKTFEKLTPSNPPNFLHGSGAAGSKILRIVASFLNEHDV